MKTWNKWGTATHHGHMVYWQGQSYQQYRLYCVTCGRYLNEYTATPNTPSTQRYEDAFASPFVEVRA